LLHRLSIYAIRYVVFAAASVVMLIVGVPPLVILLIVAAHQSVVGYRASRPEPQAGEVPVPRPTTPEVEPMGHIVLGEN
jgi:hypothetical protein